MDYLLCCKPYLLFCLQLLCSNWFSHWEYDEASSVTRIQVTCCRYSCFLLTNLPRLNFDFITYYLEWCSWFISICTSKFRSYLLRTIINVMLIIRQMIWCILCCWCCLFFSFMHFRRRCHWELLRLRKCGYSIHGAWNE